MTCIVGIEQDGVVYIGGDSAGVESVSLSICARADEKVFITDDDTFIMGFSGSFRIGQLLRYVFVPSDKPSKKDDMAYMVVDFIDALRAMQRDKGYLKRKNEVEEHDGPFLVGYNGALYSAEADFQVGRTLNGYAAVGSGAEIALGAMHATKSLRMKPEDRIKLALEASAEFCAAARAPFHILKLEPEKD